MQKVAFTRFGVSRGQEGAANSAAAEFQISSKGCEIGISKARHSASSGKMGLWQGAVQGKAANSAQGASVAQGKATNSVFRGLQVSSLSLSLSLS